MVNDCAEAKNGFARKPNFSLNKVKREKKNFFVESLDQCRRLEVREKALEMFLCDEPTSDHKVLHNIDRIFITFFFNFALIFSLFLLTFRTSNFWCLKNLIKQLFHLCLLDMRLIIANSVLHALLAI